MAGSIDINNHQERHDTQDVVISMPGWMVQRLELYASLNKRTRDEMVMGMILLGMSGLALYENDLDAAGVAAGLSDAKGRSDRKLEQELRWAKGLPRKRRPLKNLIGSFAERR